MKRRNFILSLVGGAALGWTGWKSNSYVSIQNAPSKTTGLLAKVSRSSQALGTRVSLTVYHQDMKVGNEAIDHAFKEIDLVEQQMSLYRKDSQLCQLNRTSKLVHPHPYLVEVLQEAVQLSETTGGAFDVTVQPLYRAYADSATAGEVPDSNALAEILKRVDWRNLKITQNSIELLGDHTEITLNGIAQGFASDVAVRALRSYGIEHALIDSGEIATLGNHGQDRDWSIGIKHPRLSDELLAQAALHGRCLATSGDYETRFGSGYQHHHLLDPHSGLSANELSSVSIAAPTALQADALSTAIFVLGLRKGRQLIESMTDVDALFVSKQGELTRTQHFPIIT